LTLGDYINSGENYQQGFTLWNKGNGTALNIKFQVRGRATKQTHDFPPGIHSSSSQEEAQAWAEQHKILTDYDFNAAESLSASFPGHYDTFSCEEITNTKGLLVDVTYSHCLIEYYDIFGNRYETKYTDDRLDRFEWIQPACLRIGL
jgi:hypothetical protein